MSYNKHLAIFLIAIPNPTTRFTRGKEAFFFGHLKEYWLMMKNTYCP